MGRVPGKKMALSERLARESCMEKWPLGEDWKEMRNKF